MKGRRQVTRGTQARLDPGQARAGQPNVVRRLAKWKYDQVKTVAIESKATTANAAITLVSAKAAR